VQLDAAAGVRGAKVTAGALRRLSFHLSGAQLGITATSLVVGFIAEPTVAAALEPLLGDLVGEARATSVSIVMALVIATIAQMVLGELVPKTLAIANPRTAAYLLAGPMVLVARSSTGLRTRPSDGLASNPRRS
jgi:CBS domain containing-hemolysin-like protein